MFAALVEDPTFWVAVALVLFIALLVWKKVPGLIAGALDKHAAMIRRQLDEARALKDEAQALLAQHQREQRDAAKRAEELIAAAEREAKLITSEAERGLEELIARRTAVARDKIAQAEAGAVKEVRQAAASVAAAAAAELIAAHLKSKDHDALVTDAIANLDKSVH